MFRREICDWYWKRQRSDPVHSFPEDLRRSTPPKNCKAQPLIPSHEADSQGPKAAAEISEMERAEKTEEKSAVKALEEENRPLSPQMGWSTWNFFYFRRSCKSAEIRSAFRVCRQIYYMAIVIFEIIHSPFCKCLCDSVRRYTNMGLALQNATAEVAKENGTQEKPDNMLHNVKCV